MSKNVKLLVVIGGAYFLRRELIKKGADDREATIVAVVAGFAAHKYVL